MAAVPMPKLSKSEKDYLAEDDARTMERAHEILNDGKRMSGVHKHLAKRVVSAKQLQKRLMGKS